jgi:hypothetical protein
LLGSLGRLDDKTLDLQTSGYLLKVHDRQERDAWRGLRMPSGWSLALTAYR